METCMHCDRKPKARGLCSLHYQRWKKHGDATVALHRDKITPEERRKQQAAITARWKAANRERVNEQARARALAVKLECFALFGGRCQRCGFDDHRALQVDHVDGQAGADHTSWSRAGLGHYRAILDGRADRSVLQLLCSNCNWIKRWENDECRRPKRAVSVAT